MLSILKGWMLLELSMRVLSWGSLYTELDGWTDVLGHGNNDRMSDQIRFDGALLLPVSGGTYLVCGRQNFNLSSEYYTLSKPLFQEQINRKPKPGGARFVSRCAVCINKHLGWSWLWLYLTLKLSQKRINKASNDITNLIATLTFSRYLISEWAMRQSLMFRKNWK